MPDAVRLVIASEEGDAEERVVTLPVAFGRDPDRADVVLPDRMVSRRHATLEAEDDHLVVVDLESANGTWVGDESVDRRALGPGDAVTIGAHTVRWAWVETPPPDPPAPTEDPGPPREAPDLGAAGGVVLGAEGLRFLPLAELFAGFDQAERRLGEIAEELARDGTTTGTAARLDAHDRCVAAVDALFDEELDRVAPATLSLCAPDVGVAQFRLRLAALRDLPAHGAARAAGVRTRRGELPETAAAVLLEEDRRLVDAVAEALIDALDAFAEHGREVTRAGAERLLGALRDVLVAVREADGRVAGRVRDAGLAPAGSVPE
ncbi:FHA domain-containing protein [Actinomycetospora sp. CA-101289]|uniref:FHA domain-containing protein n=1 Tax=Actinomycetospora sp. CA-101289 TaxID=3239893 RepID=UPI003D971ABA